MIFPYYLFFVFLFSSLQNKNENTCGCSPLLPLSASYRSCAKLENDFSKYPVHSAPISVNEIRGWEKQYKVKMSGLASSSPRVKGTPEDSVYTVTGYIYDARMKKNDCDLHLEIGTENPADLRMVAEITHLSCNLQVKLLSELAKRNFVYKKQNEKGIRCTLTGSGFYDGHHPEKSNKKFEQGNTWEIHPVISIELE